MIVRDTGDSWQIVLQTDHAALSGAFARRWGGNGALIAPTPLESVVTAALRHDDGWAVWERAPLVDLERKPCNFIDVHVPSHLAFWRACTAAVTEDDPYAGLLVSMHGAGIYRQRYGSQPDLKLTFEDDARELIEAFVAEQEAAYEARRQAIGASESEVWTNYRFVQVFDRLSLYFCMNNVEPGASAAIGSVQVDYDGTEVEMRIEPVDGWRVHVAPFPFAGDECRFMLRRHLLPKQTWSTSGAFRAAFEATEPVETEIVLERASVV